VLKRGLLEGEMKGQEKLMIKIERMILEVASVNHRKKLAKNHPDQQLSLTKQYFYC
jgi:hypothetical protein